MRWTVSSVALLGVVLALALFASALAIAAYQLAVASVHVDLQRQAQIIGAGLDAAATGADRPELPASRLPAETLTYYDAGGRRLVGTGPATIATNGSGAATGGDLVDIVPVGSAEQVTGLLRIAAPVSAAVDRALPWWVAIIAATILCAGIGWAAAALVARRVASPLADIAVAARSLGAGDLSARVPDSGIREVDDAVTALNRSGERLAALVRRERTLSAVASHQLRTPLAAARARLERSLADPDADLRSEIGGSLEQLDDLTATVDEIVALHRGRRMGTALDVAGLARRVQRKWTGSFADRNRPFRVRVDRDLPAVVASEQAVSQIVDSLVDNALRHGRGAATVTFRSSHGALAVAVDDEGTFARDDAESVLARESENSGLGLALATELADEHEFRLLLTRSDPTTMTLLIA